MFQYKDHLGNIRLSYAKNPQTQVLEIIEENNYYTFGLKHQGYNTDSKQIGYNYKYNGKELQDELGLNMYDYGARNYDPALGRWMNIDPLAEKSRRYSSYTYALDNPVFFIDPDGMQAEGGLDMTPKDNRTDQERYRDSKSDDPRFGFAGKAETGNSGDIEPNRKANDGEMAFDDSDNTAYRGNADGTWTQASSLDGVVVAEPSKKSVRTGVFEPSATNYGTVVGNVLTVAELVKDSKIGEFARAGAPASELISNGLSKTGKVLGGIGIASGFYQYGTGKISGTEFLFDTTFAVIGYFGPIGAVISLSYSLGKAGYEYYSGETLFEKPKN